MISRYICKGYDGVQRVGWLERYGVPYSQACRMWLTTRKWLSLGHQGTCSVRIARWSLSCLYRQRYYLISGNSKSAVILDHLQSSLATTTLTRSLPSFEVYATPPSRSSIANCQDADPFRQSSELESEHGF
jgi:hypothetical protein